MDALIGHTGFVGSELARRHDFGAKFDSKTIGGIGRSRYRTVVCAAAPGSMLEANRMPDRDAARIDALIESLRAVEATTFVLISTIAVLKGFSADDERTEEFEKDVPYGVNRRRLEAFVLEHFDRPLVLRLPALFGGVLRKNFLFDIMNRVPTMLTAEKLSAAKAELGADLAGVIAAIYTWDADLSLHVIDRAALDASGRRDELEAAIDATGFSATQFTNPASRFQYYDIGKLWTDIVRGVSSGLRILHLSPVPIAAAEIYRAMKGTEMPQTGARVHLEDMRTAHSELWGKQGPYIADADEVIAGIRRYFSQGTAA